MATRPAVRRWTGAWGSIVADYGNDTINAGDGNNVVSAGEGRNTLVTGSGTDTINALGSNVVMAGGGADQITLGWGNDWVAAGRGNDSINAGGGNNLFAFNKGDGADTVVSGNWSNDTISLGGGIRYADMKLSRSGNDLVLLAGGGDQIALKDWYASAASRCVTQLQVLTVGADFDASSTSPLKNRPVEVFDFTKLVAAFDAARAATPAVATGWALSGTLSAAQLYGVTGPASSPTYVNPWVALQAGTALMDSAPTSAILPIATSPQGSIDQLLFAALNSSGTTGAAGWRPA